MTVDRTLLTAAEHVRALADQTEATERAGVCQAVTPVVSLVGTVALLVFAASRRSLAPLVLVGCVALALALASRLRPREILGRTLPVTAMASVVVLPRAVLTPGPALWGPITVDGVWTVAVFVTRALVCVSLVVVLVYTTRFRALLGAMERLGVPSVFVQHVAITRRYLLVFVDEVVRVVRARRSRRIAPRTLRAAWRDAGSLLARFFLRTLDRAEGVQRAARARGGGGVAAYDETRPLGRADYGFTALVAVTLLGGLAL